MEKPRAWEGFSAWWNELRENAQMITMLVAILSVAYLLAASWTYKWYVTKNGEDLWMPLRWGAAELAVYTAETFKIRPFTMFADRPVKLYWEGKIYELPAREALPWFREKKNFLVRIVLTGVGGYFAWIFLTMWLANRIFLRKAGKFYNAKKKRGTSKIEAKKLNKKARKTFGPGRVKITRNITLPRILENRHIFVVGSSGTGKSTFIKHILSQLRRYEGIRNIVFDLKGEYTSIFYEPGRGDMIFNPIDKRCAQWDIFT